MAGQTGVGAMTDPFTQSANVIDLRGVAEFVPPLAVVVVLAIMGIWLLFGTWRQRFGAWLIAAAIILIVLPAVADERHHPPQDEAIHEQFYSTWYMPDHPERSCCNKAGCYPTEIKYQGRILLAKRREDGAWIVVPAAKIERNRDNPDGRNHVLCATAKSSRRWQDLLLLARDRRLRVAKENYNQALIELLKHEGGYSNNPADPGGPTNFGITLADYRKYIDSTGNAADVRAMTVDQAKAIYRAKYWDAQRCDELPPGVDYAIFDYGVNSGIGRSGKVLRRVLQMPSESSTVTSDVIRAANTRQPAALVGAICDERLRFLQGLGTWGTFGAGWTRRVREVRALALRMAAAKPSPVPVPPAPRPVPPQAGHWTLAGAIAAILAALGTAFDRYWWLFLLAAAAVIALAWWKRPKG
jgi:lysozyme family protein